MKKETALKRLLGAQSLFLLKLGECTSANIEGLDLFWTGMEIFWKPKKCGWSFNKGSGRTVNLSKFIQS